MNIRKILRIAAPIIPVLNIIDISHAVPLARVLLDSGLRVLEITLRNSIALPAIKKITDAFPDAIIGVGTVTTPPQLLAAKAAGALFAVSPGLNIALAQAAKVYGLPLLPGAMTPTEVMNAINTGYDTLKFFPAQAAGGMAMLQSLMGPFPKVHFCPTGGITLSNANDFLSLSNVLCIGGSWLCPTEVIAKQQWDTIAQIAHKTLQTLHK